MIAFNVNGDHPNNWIRGSIWTLRLTQMRIGGRPLFNYGPAGRVSGPKIEKVLGALGDIFIILLLDGELKFQISPGPVALKAVHERCNMAAESRSPTTLPNWWITNS